MNWRYKYRLRLLQWCFVPDRVGNYLTQTIAQQSTRTDRSLQ
ncbi:MAG: hypothetical protein ACO3NK_01270 [Prochlorotrichaceae cyanobacterium]